jgi:two-component system cell cycle sensor histidine kinase/response regulator CckA
MRDELERLRAVFELSGDAIFILDEAGRFVDVNPIACSRYGYSRAEFTQLQIGALDTEDERHLVPERMSRIIDGGGASFVAKHLAKDGHVIPTEVNSRTVVIGGRRYFISICRDVSERLAAEEARRKLEAKMVQAQKLESLGVLAGGIAHDFNNLLLAILGHCEVALSEVSPISAIREDLVAIERAAQRAAHLSRQMLAYTGKGHFVVQPLGLRELVEEMGPMLSVSLSKKVALRFDLDASAPAVLGDPSQLRQVVVNLVTNASEAVGDRSGTIVVAVGAARYAKGRLAALPFGEELPEGAYAWLEVRDDGRGMDAATLPRIFDPFFTTKFVGRGLGLAAVQGIVRAHRGAVELASEPGKGTTFRVLLPAAPEGAAATRPGPAPVRWRGAGLVLLADDEELVRSAGVRMLERLGFRVITAADGHEAVTLFEAHRAELRCAILDLTMPRMDGEQAFRAIRRIDPSAKVLVASGHGEQQLAERFAGSGLTAIVEKPYRLEALAALLEPLLA